MTRDEAIELAKTRWWKKQPCEIVARFQLQEEKLCMDFGDFHAAVEKALCRPVYTHEFANGKLLLDELNGKREAPTMQEIVEMIPEAKRIIVLAP